MNKKLKIAISVDHMGKPNKPLDRGACYHHVNESDLCMGYAFELYKELTKTGHSPLLLCDGTYKGRAIRANNFKADLYLSCHLNSSETPPRNPYSMVEISELSGPTTKRFADYLKACFKLELPVEDSRVWHIKRNQRGWRCISGVIAPALLLEPLFMNDSKGFKIALNYPAAIADCIADAINSFDWS